MKTYIMTEDQQMVCDLAGSLAGTELKARSEKVDHENLYPAEGLGFFAEAGLIACAIPEEMGGAGLDHMSQAIVLREAAKECGSTAYAMALTSACTSCIALSAETESREEIIEAVLGGAAVTAAAEDAGALVTAETFGEGFVLNGTIRNVPAAGVSAYLLIPAKTGNETRWFVAAAGQNGMEMKDQKPALGMKGCRFSTLYFDNCRVSRGALVNSKAAAMYRDVMALYMAAVAAGIASGAIAEAIAYDNQRVQFGRTIAQFENTQQVLAKLLSQAEAAAALVYGAAQVMDAGENASAAAAMAKVFASDVAAVASKNAVQLMGGYGYSREYPVERKMRDAKMTELLGTETAELGFAIAEELVVHA